MKDPVQAWLERATATCRELVAQHAVLALHVASGGGGGGDGRSATKVRPGLVIREDVVDLRVAIEGGAKRYASLVRGTLRRPLTAPALPGPRLLFVAAGLVDLHAADPDLAAEVVEWTWERHREACRVVEPPRGMRPFRIEDTCPGCGYASLWLDPGGWRLGCGMPHCRRVWGVDEPVLASETEEVV